MEQIFQIIKLDFVQPQLGMSLVSKSELKLQLHSKTKRDLETGPVYVFVPFVPNDFVEKFK